jgi:hypothetical protein
MGPSIDDWDKEQGDILPNNIAHLLISIWEEERFRDMKWHVRFFLLYVLISLDMKSSNQCESLIVLQEEFTHLSLCADGDFIKQMDNKIMFSLY